MIVIPVALQPYADQPRWVVWKREKKDDKFTKVPYQAHAPNKNAKPNDPATWADGNAAIKTAVNGNFDGIGVCLLGSDLAAFDIDNCRDPTTGTLHPFADKLVKRCNSYTEITPSQKGLRIIGRGNGAKTYRNQKVEDKVSCESYCDREKYITVTGDHLAGTPETLADIGQTMAVVVEELDAAVKKKKGAAKTDDDDVSELPAFLTTRLYILDKGAGEPHANYTTRSELLFAFIVDALKATIAAEAIVTACLDEAHRGCAIYEHCADNNGRDYVLRQIDNARAKIKEGLDAAIAEINKIHALVLAGDKAAIMKLEENKPFRLITVGAFRQWYANQQITVGRRLTSIGDYWLTHSQRRQYEGIEFDPSGGTPNYYNMFTGFGVEPREGDCLKFLNHVYDNVAQGNQNHYDWIIGFFAQIFQQMMEKPGTSLCLRGPMGVGKTIVGEIIGGLLPGYYQLVSDPRYIVGRFNAHMAQCVLLHADEAFWAGDKRGEGKLKDLVTGKYHLLEYKHIDPIRVRNLIRLFVTGNQDWLVPAGFGERRFAVFDVGNKHMQDIPYFKAIVDEQNNGGGEALLYHLIHFDLSKVNLREIPKTEALFEQIIETATPEQAWWFNTLKYGALPAGCKEPDRCPRNTLFRHYIRHAKLQGVARRAIETKIGMFLNKYVGPELTTEEKQEYEVHVRDRKYKDTGRVYVFPPLSKCREVFAKEMQHKVSWGEPQEWEKEGDWVEDHDVFL